MAFIQIALNIRRTTHQLHPNTHHFHFHRNHLRDVKTNWRTLHIFMNVKKHYLYANRRIKKYWSPNWVDAHPLKKLVQFKNCFIVPWWTRLTAGRSIRNRWLYCLWKRNKLCSYISCLNYVNICQSFSEKLDSEISSTWRIRQQQTILQCGYYHHFQFST